MLVALLSACDVEPDVVAELGIEGYEQSWGDDRCSDVARQLLLEDEAGGLFWMSTDDVMRWSIARPTCLASGLRAGAIERNGRIWASSGGMIWWIDPITGACTASPLTMDAQTLAFVYDPARKRELLYAIAADTLFVLEPDSQAYFELGVLTAERLIGTTTGALYALSTTSITQFLFSRVGLDGAPQLLTRGVIPAPVLAGAATWRGGFIMIAGQSTFRFEDADQYSVSTLPISVANVLASNCASLTR
ncbi:MAG TPA: hypothetical protein VFX59_24115 [Polyangiales bacterium]|nr:hypothetical protein [Polyangiales bacterium]